MSYNGVGLNTVRGSGTNGFVQRNLAFIRPKARVISAANELDRAPPVIRKANPEIMEHQRKRKIELQCLLLREKLEERGMPEDEIDEKVEKARAELERQKAAPSTGDDTHSKNQQKEVDNEKLRQAFGIKKDYEGGSSFKSRDEMGGGDDADQKDKPEKPLQKKQNWLARSADETDGKSKQERTEEYRNNKRRRSRSPSPKGGRGRRRDSRDDNRGRRGSRDRRDDDRGRGRGDVNDRWEKRSRSRSVSRSKSRNRSKSRSRSRSPRRKEEKKSTSPKKDRKDSGKDKKGKKSRRSRSPSSSSSSSSGSSSSSSSSSSDSD